MALFRLPSAGPPALAPRGNGLLLRAPQMSDFMQWTQLREYSREYLTPENGIGVKLGQDGAKNLADMWAAHSHDGPQPGSSGGGKGHDRVVEDRRPRAGANHAEVPRRMQCRSGCAAVPDVLDFSDAMPRQF